LGVLKNGKELELRIWSIVSRKPDGGIADALAFAEDFSDGEPIAVISDNTTDLDIPPGEEF
jgi:dTDP-glucose pyrophosphorylase